MIFTLDELEHAYSITVHKSQGSEFNYNNAGILVSSYTCNAKPALYRSVQGKKAVILVGSENRMHAMIDNNRITERYSGLAVG